MSHFVIDITTLPIFYSLPHDEQQVLLAVVSERAFAAGQTIFAEGDPAETLYLHLSGKCMLSENARPIGEARSNSLLNLIPVIGGMAHTQRAVAMTDCRLLVWSVSDLMQNAAFEAEARRYLAAELQDAQKRIDQLEAPIHYLPGTAQLPAGPFVFNRTTLFMAFCDVDLGDLTLPEGLTLARPAWRNRDSVLLAIAEFRDAHPDSQPEATFNYTETTYIVPVRQGRKFGFFPAWIYPSTYEPILLGREIYGFPKRLGRTTFAEGECCLSVDGEPHFCLTYHEQQNASEPRLIRALSDWLGIRGRLVEAAFRVGDTLLGTMGTPLYRRVSVYNHKQIPSVIATAQNRTYDVNQLTQAVFSVMKWHHIASLPDAALMITGGPLHYADLKLREAYHTQLDLRLSTGRVVQDYE